MTTFSIHALTLRRSDGDSIDASVEAPFPEDGGRGPCRLGIEEGDGEATFVEMTPRSSVLPFGRPQYIA